MSERFEDEILVRRYKNPRTITLFYLYTIRERVQVIDYYMIGTVNITGSAVALHCVKAHRQSQWRSRNSLTLCKIYTA